MVSFPIFINMEDKKFVVYEHYTPDTNELFYVGEGRPDRPFSTRNRNRYWKFKVKKHNGFVVKIVKDDITKEDAEKLEEFLISEYRKKNFELTNMCDGTMFGTHWLVGKPKELHPFFGKKHPNPKLAEWNKLHCGELSPVYGIKRPDLSERNKSGQFKRFTRKVICIETGVIYDSIKLATIAMGKNPNCTSINKHLGGNRKHAFGYQWAYYEN
jgi:hypothetical protein